MARTLQVLEVLRRGTGYLSRSTEIATPRRDAEVLLAHALSLSRLDLYLQFDRPLTEEELTRTRGLLTRRRKDEPMAYLLGEAGFYGLDFEVGPGVLIPRPESELLVEVALAHLRGVGQGPVRVADLGCGSGCLGIAIAVNSPAAEVEAVDTSEVAVASTTRNALKHQVSDRVTPVLASWSDPLGWLSPADLVVANPPYISTEELRTLDRSVRDYEPVLALDGGPDGLDAYRQLLRALAPVLGPGTVICLEVDPRRIRGVEALADEVWPGAHLEPRRDLDGQERVLQIQISR